MSQSGQQKVWTAHELTAWPGSLAHWPSRHRRDDKLFTRVIRVHGKWQLSAGIGAVHHRGDGSRPVPAPAPLGAEIPGSGGEDGAICRVPCLSFHLTSSSHQPILWVAFRFSMRRQGPSRFILEPSSLYDVATRPGNTPTLDAQCRPFSTSPDSSSMMFDLARMIFSPALDLSVSRIVSRQLVKC